MSKRYLDRRQIDNASLQDIYSSDQLMYPAPLPFEKLKSWIDAAPELSIGYWLSSNEGIQNDNLAGVIVVLPILWMHWNHLLRGIIEEADVEAAMLAIDKQKSLDVGLHIFHIERYAAWGNAVKITNCSSPFSDHAMKDIADLVQETAWNVVGYSGKHKICAAYTNRRNILITSAAVVATQAGMGCFNRMGFHGATHAKALAPEMTEDGQNKLTKDIHYSTEVERAQAKSYSRSNLAVEPTMLMVRYDKNSKE